MDLGIETGDVSFGIAACGEADANGVAEDAPEAAAAAPEGAPEKSAGESGCARIGAGAMLETALDEPAGVAAVAEPLPPEPALPEPEFPSTTCCMS